jgi:hypothetical protein
LIRYRGRTLPCDSALRRDGESLRSIVENTPDALDELEQYQSGRNSIKFAAYTGSTGLAMVIFSGLLADVFVSESKSDQNARAVKIVRWGGAGLAIGSIVYGLSHLRSNEDHLHRTILNYNIAHPDRPIEILFKTEF